MLRPEAGQRGAFGGQVGLARPNIDLDTSCDVMVDTAMTREEDGGGAVFLLCQDMFMGAHKESQLYPMQKIWTTVMDYDRF